MAAVDKFDSSPTRLTGSLVGAFAITPNDTDDLPYVTRQLYVGGSGNIAVIWQDGSETVEPVTIGERLPWRISRVKLTDTTATGLRGYY